MLHPQGPWLSRLRLVISTEQLRSLDFRMPADTSLVRVRLDGAEILPVMEGALISIGLPAPGPGQRLKTVDLDYEVRGRSLPADAVLRPVLPQIALPCLSFCWELAVPPSWRAADEGPGLVASDATPARNWPLGCPGSSSGLLDEPEARHAISWRGAPPANGRGDAIHRSR